MGYGIYPMAGCWICYSMTCSVSMLTKRTDGFNPLVNQVNNLLEKAFKSEAHIDIINNEAINEYHLNGSGLHLNRKCNAALARNVINHNKNKPNFLNESAESGLIEIDQDKMPAGNGSSPIPENETSKSWCKGTSKFPRFKFMSLSIFSLLPHLDNLRLLVDDEKPHIMCINETKLDSSIGDSLIPIDDYVIVRKDRNVHGGGVAPYVHQNAQFELREDLICDELESVTVQIKKMAKYLSLSHRFIDHQGNQSDISVSLSPCLAGWNHKIKNLLSWVI